MDQKDIDDLVQHVDSTAEILRSLSSLSSKMDESQKKADHKERRRFLVTTVIALLSFMAGVVAAVCSILALLPD